MNVANVAKVLQVPPPTVSPTATVLEAVRIMERLQRGAAVVVDGERLVGIISERDVMLRVVWADRDPHQTLVGEVMTWPVETISTQGDMAQAFGLMMLRQVRHIPVLDEEGKVLGLLSIRHLGECYLAELADEVQLLKAYAGL